MQLSAEPIYRNMNCKLLSDPKSPATNLNRFFFKCSYSFPLGNFEDIFESFTKFSPSTNRRMPDDWFRHSPYTIRLGLIFQKQCLPFWADCRKRKTVDANTTKHHSRCKYKRDVRRVGRGKDSLNKRTSDTLAETDMKAGLVCHGTTNTWSNKIKKSEPQMFYRGDHWTWAR